jgi:hypothetical protein
MISSEQRIFLENLYETQEWFGQSLHPDLIRHFPLGAIYLHGWHMHRLWRNPSPPSSTGMIVREGDKLDEISTVASIYLWECSDITSAHEQLLNVLGEIQSNAMKRDQKRGIGDILFTLNDTIFLFARMNLVALIRNAGSRAVGVGDIAGTIDIAILRHIQKSV